MLYWVWYPVAMNQKDTTRRRLLAASVGIGFTGVAGCAQLVAVPEEEEPDPVVTQDVMFEIPQYVEPDGTPVYNDDGLRFIDYSNIAHGLILPATAMRQSQWGHENYDAEMYWEDMPRVGNLWVEFVENDLIGAFARELDGRTWPYLTEHEDGWVREGEPRLQELQMATYVYHAHHRSGRFEEHDGLFRDLTFTTPDYQAAVGRFLLDERRQNGSFYHDEDLSDRDNESMAYGLAGANTHWYAFVRHVKGSGEGDMWRVPRETLVDFLGYDIDVLADVALDIKAELDGAWDESAGVYDFGGTTYPIDAVGAMIRGGKVLYDAIHEFAGDEQEAMDQFEKTTRMFDELAESDIVEPWGLPAEVTFTSNGLEAASDTVDVERQWTCLSHFTNGYALNRDRFTDLLADNRPDIYDDLGEIADTLLLGAMDHQLDGGELVTELDYGSGEITDDRRSAAAVGIFTAVAVEAYGEGEAFTSASDWDDASAEVVNQSRDLYDMVVRHRELIENAFLIEAQ